MRKLRVAVYDPSPLNPYGLEVAAQLADMGHQVEWFTTPEAGSFTEIDNLWLKPVLAGRASRKRLISRGARRGWGPAKFVYTCLRGRTPVVVWIRDPLDAFLLLLLTTFGVKPIVIYHNPRQIRSPRRGLFGLFERSLLARAIVCVHSTELATFARHDYCDVRITPHPNFDVTTRLAPDRAPESRCVVFIGALRPDKGAEVLCEVLTATRGNFTFRTVGLGSLDPHQARILEEAGIVYESIGGDKPVDEMSLLHHLSRATVVLAPYTQPTESSTALLAMAVGAPMIGMGRGALQRVLTPASQAADAHGLGMLLDRFLDSSWDTWAVTPEQQRHLSRLGWEAAFHVD